jgi:hypothetical protein
MKSWRQTEDRLYFTGIARVLLHNFDNVIRAVSDQVDWGSAGVLARSLRRPAEGISGSRQFTKK